MCNHRKGDAAQEEPISSLDLDQEILLYPIKAVMKQTIQVTLLTVEKVSVVMNCRHSGHCVLLGYGGSFSKSRITVGAVGGKNKTKMFTFYQDLFLFGGAVAVSCFMIFSSLSFVNI